MKILSVALFFLFISLTGWSQKQHDTVNFVADVLRARPMKNSRPAVVAQVDSFLAIYYFSKFQREKSKVYYSRTSRADSMELTGAEIQSLIDGYHASIRYRWKASELKGFQPIEWDSAAPYLQADSNRTAAFITKPVFIRNGTVALCLFGNLCCKNTTYIIDLFFYRKRKNHWERWVPIVDPMD